MTGIGGDCFILLYEPDGNIIGINGSGRTSAKLDIEGLPQEDNGRLTSDSIHAVTVPGSVKAWEPYINLMVTFHSQVFYNPQFNTLPTDFLSHRVLHTTGKIFVKN